MGARTGKAYIEGLRDDRRIYVNGELVHDVTRYRPFQGVIHTLADLYDRQYDPTYQPLMTTAVADLRTTSEYVVVLAKTPEEMALRIKVNGRVAN